MRGWRAPVYTLDEVYIPNTAVSCETAEQVLALLEAIRANPPEGFMDHWIGGEGREQFVPAAPVAICLHGWDNTANLEIREFGWCDATWYEEEGYTVLEFADLDLTLTERELVTESFESLFDLGVTRNV